ncbi:single-stranded DNA-binding protein [Isoptericola sp. b490]|uniref:single-stranded DNA-binding protein n=1 Tax=Actinotalea lenta TaxID=3064654 RepID=UPI0027127520|nr:single-stranded DNA-binding protein [Isoptericola sp. b490]MDO8121109.1 single-stranded DNA-binding protein [Isoptericola sp. b490]
MRKAATITVTGWAGSTPREVSGGGVPFTSFRIPVTERRFDQRTQAWGDGPTEWYTVKAFRDLALNVAESIRKGDPVVVTGRLRTEVWQSDKGPQPGFVIDADAVGHDLAWGASSFRRRVHRSDASEDPQENAGQAGPPARDDGMQDAAGPAADPWATPAADPDEAGVPCTP